MFSPGQQFADYRIVRVLGAGGMGEVYLAKHPRLPREDALKVLPTELTDDPTYRARFIREADLAAGLDHSSIVSVYDRGEDQGQLWITMKYIPGSDANVLMKQSGPFAVQDVVDVVTSVADALDYAHGKGLLHRDVKPANILIDGTSATRHKIYLTDFGIARTLGNDTALTAANLTVGSIQYTSPEQLRGGDLNGRADQYSLACTAFKLLTGRAPYPERKPTEIINAHLNSPIPHARELRPELPGEVDAVLARGMDKKAVNRYPTCADFARDLKAALRASGGAPRFPATMINPGPSRPPTPPAPPRPSPAPPHTPAQPPPAQPTSTPSPWAQQPSGPQPSGPQAPGPQTPGPPPQNAGLPYPGAQQPGTQQPGTQQSGPQQFAPQQFAYGSGPLGPQPPYGGPPQPPYGPPGGNGSGPGGGRGKQIVLILGAIVLVAALATGLAFVVKAAIGDDGDDEADGPSSTVPSSVTTSPSTSNSNPAVVNGVPTQCVNGQPASNTSTRQLSSGKISIPSTVLPSGWDPDRGTHFPFVAQADGVTLNRPPGAATWVAQIAVGVLPSDFNAHTEEIARKYIECLSVGPGYDTVSVGALRYGQVINAKVDNRDTDYTLLNATIPVSNGPSGVTGDDVLVVVVDSRPMTVAIGISPIGDASTQQAVDKAVRGLLVRD
ncbi:serine/threonine-protein kinase [Gordonia liuliyuniae]|uniref:non-specific serine/threonine protein kinase n=1 Tax=Gordonia liuliyuniae TaxID=2911517 RepID=A0ABS9IQM7_9ACTN|nr:serine/threonine-protein kinase [Gordonia liuliyuniae]MCF8587863.1 serine/threonine protein kinase [Gordonia liuliyuniae]